MLEFIEWLSLTPWSIGLRESLYMYPWIESAHVLFIAIFFGTLLFVDLRLTGHVFQELSISQMNKRILPLTIIGFVFMCITGFLLFYAVPIRNYLNLFFRIKFFLIIIAGLFDLLDGRVARLLKTTSNFGMHLDSLSDFVVFVD